MTTAGKFKFSGSQSRNARLQYQSWDGDRLPYVLLWLARNRGWSTPRFLTFKQALEAGGHVRKGEHGTKVYFIKQLQIKDGDADETEARLVPMLREYTVFNVDQCDGLPDSVRAGKPMHVLNPDTRDALADEFLSDTGVDMREGNGEAYYVPSHDFISMPAFQAFKGADHFLAWRSMS